MSKIVIEFNKTNLFDNCIQISLIIILMYSTFTPMIYYTFLSEKLEVKYNIKKFENDRYLISSQFGDLLISKNTFIKSKKENNGKLVLHKSIIYDLLENQSDINKFKNEHFKNTYVLFSFNKILHIMILSLSISSISIFIVAGLRKNDLPNNLTLLFVFLILFQALMIGLVSNEI